MVTDHNQTYHSDNFEIYRNIKTLCCVTGTNSVVGQLYFKNKLTEKEITFVVTRSRWWRKEELDEGR